MVVFYSQCVCRRERGGGGRGVGLFIAYLSCLNFHMDMLDVFQFDVMDIGLTLL